MNNLTSLKEIISSRPTDRNSTYRNDVLSRCPGPRAHSDGSFIQFADRADDLRGIAQRNPFQKIAVPMTYYRDLMTLQIARIGDKSGSDDQTSIDIDFDWKINVPTMVVKTYGVMSINLIGKVMIGAYYYNLQDDGSADKSTDYVIYRRSTDGSLAPVPLSKVINDGYKTSSTFRATDHVDISFVQLALMLMRELGMGYFVRPDIVELDDCLVVSDDSNAGFFVSNAKTEDIPLMRVTTNGITDEFKARFDEFMGSTVFSSQEDYDNYCMGVFYSVASINGTPHYFTMSDEGGSGKSTLLDGLAKFAAPITTKSLRLEALTKTGFEHGMAVTQLEGKKIAIQDEISAITPKAVVALNELSSGSNQAARYGGGVYRWVTVKLALWFAGNVSIDLPEIDAVKRRRVSISLKNSLLREDWTAPIDWDTEDRPLYELVASREAYSVMFYRGLLLWHDRNGEFFQTMRDGVDGDSDCSMSGLASAASCLCSEWPELVDKLLTVDSTEMKTGVEYTMFNAVGRGKDVHSALKTIGFRERVTSHRANGKTIAVKHPVIDNAGLLKDSLRALRAMSTMEEDKVPVDSITVDQWSKIVSGSLEVDDVIEHVSIEDSKTGSAREYAVIQLPGLRPDVGRLIKDTRGMKPTSILHGFMHDVSMSSLEQRTFKMEQSFDTGVDWSKIEAVEDGLRWAKAMGLCKFIDVETGEATIGTLNKMDLDMSVQVLLDKFGHGW